MLLQAVASYETRRRSTVGSDVVVWRNEIDTLLQLVQVSQLLLI
jgi:hypothetical protein